MSIDLLKIFMSAFMIGGLFTFLGWVIKSQNAGDMINGFDEKKYDKDKTSQIIGRNFILIGLSVICISFFGNFINADYYKYIGGIQVAILLVGLAITTYEFFKFCKRDK